MFAIIGVSGGSVGAATFAAALHIGQPPQRAAVAAHAPTHWQAALHADLLAPTMKALLGSDFFTRCVPTALVDPSSLDRNHALENAWSAGWYAATSSEALANLTFSDIAPTDTRPRPNLLLMTTGIADGEPMAISHLCNIGVATLAQIRPGLNVPLTTAAIMSARFPMISTAARLPGDPSGTGYVDGGYFENSGLTATLRLIHSITREDAAPVSPSHDRQQPPPEAKQSIVNRVSTAITVIRIENGETDPAEGSASKSSELLGPVSALYRTGMARGRESARNLTNATSATSDCGDAPDCVPIHQIRFRLVGPATIPLGWLLSAQARDEIAAQISGLYNCRSFEDVGTALGAPSSIDAGCPSEP